MKEETQHPWYQWAEHYFEQLAKEIAHMNAAIAALSTQVASTVAAEGLAATALKNFATKLADLQTQLNAAVANGLSADDTAALSAAASSLSASATALSAATPATA